MDLYTLTTQGLNVFYIVENGRTYHAQEREALYPFPNDAKAHEVEHETHKIYLELFKGQLHLAPLSQPQRVLDLGSGSGLWMSAFANVHPSAFIAGIDLSLASVSPGAPNTVNKLGDIETPGTWDFEDPFDYIHARDLFGSIDHPDWLLKRCYDSLSDGGCFEYQDFGLPTCDTGTIGEESVLGQWKRTCHEALAQIHRCSQLSDQIPFKMKATGFVGIKMFRTELPLGPWPRGRRLNAVGRRARKNFLADLDGFSLRMFTRFLKEPWSVSDLKSHVAALKSEIKASSLELYIPIFTIYGWKQSPSTVQRSGLGGGASRQDCFASSTMFGVL